VCALQNTILTIYAQRTYHNAWYIKAYKSRGLDAIECETQACTLYSTFAIKNYTCRRGAANQ